MWGFWEGSCQSGIATMAILNFELETCGGLEGHLNAFALHPLNSLHAMQGQTGTVTIIDKNQLFGYV